MVWQMVIYCAISLQQLCKSKNIYGNCFSTISCQNIICSKCWYWFGWKFQKIHPESDFWAWHHLIVLSRSTILLNYLRLVIQGTSNAPLDLENCVFWPNFTFQELKLELVRTQLQVRIRLFFHFLLQNRFYLLRPLSRPFARLQDVYSVVTIIEIISDFLRFLKF